MESLFSTNINIHDKKVVYRVYFDREKYIFSPEIKDEQLPSFSFKREQDE